MEEIWISLDMRLRAPYERFGVQSRIQDYQVNSTPFKLLAFSGSVYNTVPRILILPNRLKSITSFVDQKLELTNIRLKYF